MKTLILTLLLSLSVNTFAGTYCTYTEGSMVCTGDTGNTYCTETDGNVYCN